MIEEDFYATVKLKTGEEIFAKVAASEEEDRTMLLISNPVIISEIKNNKLEVVGYKMEPWLKTTSEDLLIINLEDVITMTESSDIEMIILYQNYIRQSSKKGNSSKISRKMGYLANVNDAKEILEKIFKSS
jgi:Sm_like domain